MGKEVALASGMHTVTAPGCVLWGARERTDCSITGGMPWMLSL